MCGSLGIVAVDMLDQHCIYRICLEVSFCDLNGDDYIGYNNGMHVHFIPPIRFMKRNFRVLTNLNIVYLIEVCDTILLDTYEWTYKSCNDCKFKQVRFHLYIYILKILVKNDTRFKLKYAYFLFSIFKNIVVICVSMPSVI